MGYWDCSGGLPQGLARPNGNQVENAWSAPFHGGARGFPVAPDHNLLRDSSVPVEGDKIPSLAINPENPRCTYRFRTPSAWPVLPF